MNRPSATMTKSKLSKSILEMKFMKRSRDKYIQEEASAEGREIFKNEITEEMRSGRDKFIVEPSYVPCLDLTVGRFSFGGMNPHIERIMELEAEALRPKVTGDMDKDITDEEMALRRKRTHSTGALEVGNPLIGSIAAKFITKREKANKQKKFMKPQDD